MALERPPQEVWPLLIECITNDPRVDQQCESRAEYYGSLILRTGMDLEPIHSFVKRNDDSTVGLILETLESLAEQGSHRATEILREYLIYGREVVWIARVLANLPVQGAIEGMDEVLCRRVSGDPQLYEEFRRSVEWSWRWYCRHDEDTRKKGGYLLPVCEPWKSLCRKNSGLAGLFARVGLPYDNPPVVREVTDVDMEGLSVEELLSTADKARFYPSKRALIERVSAADEDRLLQSLSSDNKYRVMLAFCGLGELGTPKAFEAVKSYIEGSEKADRSVRRRAFDAIEQMPDSLTLGTARQWFRRKEWYLQVAAGCILENHATPEDIPLLIEALRTPEALREEDYRLLAALRALTRFEDLGRIPELEQVFRQTANSFRRADAAEAMAATSPDFFAAEYACECLHDCEWSVFKVGCGTTDLSTPGATDRLRKVADDAYELDYRREYAKERLEGVIG